MLDALAARGIVAAQDVSQVRTGTVMVTAHGTSQRTLARTRALGLTVVEATCPLVHVAHRAVAALARDGYHVVIVGQRDHVEVRGLTGDLDRFDVVLDDDDVLALDEHPRIGVAAQTTQSLEKVRRIVALIRQRFPASDVRFIDTVCKPTKERQTAAVDMARQADVVIVVGGAIEQQHARAGEDVRAALRPRAPRADRRRRAAPSGCAARRSSASRPAPPRRTRSSIASRRAIRQIDERRGRFAAAACREHR